MSVKRRDSKNRILRTGESQRKDGRYVYKYQDSSGNAKFLYAWKLEPNDKLPSGKRDPISLREKEKEIEKIKSSGMSIITKYPSVSDIVKQYLDQNIKIKQSTSYEYRSNFLILSKYDFFNKPINKVKISDAKQFFIQMRKESGYKYGTLKNFQSMLQNAFQAPVEDDILLKNPFSFSMSQIIPNDSGHRTALTYDEEEEFLQFVKEDRLYHSYYDGFYILLKTGLRIAEFCGLTFDDVNFDKETITVQRQLRGFSPKSFYIETPKSKSGYRTIPMLDGVSDCFQRIISTRRKPIIEPIIDGITGFLNLTRQEHPTGANIWEIYFSNVVKKYNATHTTQLPHITPHVCRHTFCSRMAKLGINPKALQYLMGHSDATFTMNVYTHTTFEDVSEEVARIMQR